MVNDEVILKEIKCDLKWETLNGIEYSVCPVVRYADCFVSFGSIQGRPKQLKDPCTAHYCLFSVQP